MVAALSISSLAAAGYIGPSDENQPQNAKAVLDKPKDDQFVVLKGYLIKQVSSDKYQFGDDSGEIRVEIDHNLFTSDPIDENTLVEIRGEVEKDFMDSPEIDVNHLAIIQPAQP
ncbi:MAG: NirD/YgiW/YdeI family stress tolerance protein [Hydrogenovibrio sp.]